MRDDVERTTRALVGAWTWLADELPSGVHAEQDGVVVAASGLPFPPLNPAFVVREPEDPAAAVQWAATTRRDRGAPSTGIDLPDGRFPAVESALESLGYVRHVTRPGMSTATLDVDAGPRPAGLQVREVVSEADWAAQAELQVATFGFAPDIARAFPPYDLIGATPRMTILVGESDGEVVCAATVFVSGTEAAVFGVATLEARRRQGFGAAVTAAAVDVAGTHGAERVHLQSSADGFGVYRRIGFRETGMWVVWVDPAAEN